MKCSKCRNSLEGVHKGGKLAFMFCRACKLPHDPTGGVLIDTRTLSTGFNPLAIARGIIGSTHADAQSVTRSALEVLLIQGLQESYFTGLKEGVLLAYSQDVRDGEPHHGSVHSPSDMPQKDQGKQ